MHRPHGAGAVADGGRHAFHGPVANIAGSEHAGHAGLERQRPAAQHVEGLQIIGKILAGEHESVIIQGDPVEPRRRGHGSNEAEQSGAGHHDGRDVAPGSEGDVLEGRVPSEGDDLGAGVHVDPRIGDDPIGEVSVRFSWA